MIKKMQEERGEALEILRYFIKFSFVFTMFHLGPLSEHAD